MTEIIELLREIPVAFWSAIVGSLLTLGGVALSNRSHHQRLLVQLEHERLQKRQDREMQLRKEVYLEAAEAISAGLNLIPRLADLNVPYEKLGEQYAEKSAAVSRLHVVATGKTAKALAQLTSELSTTYFRLLAKRHPLVRDQQQVAFLGQQINQFASERDRMLMLMKQANIEGAMDERKWNVLDENFKFEQERVDDTIVRQRQLQGEHYQRHLDYFRECLEASRGIAKLVIPLLAAVREEMELPFDEQAYAQTLEEVASRQEATIQQFIEDARRLNSAA